MKRIAGILGVPSWWPLGEGYVDIGALERSMFELPGVAEDGMSGRNGQRKLGTTRGSPRRSRTAKASRISRLGKSFFLDARQFFMSPDKRFREEMGRILPKLPKRSDLS